MAKEFPCHHLKNTARGIIVHNGQILLIERWRPGFHYFSIPGGGIEPGETPEQTVVREIMEETSIKVEVKQQVLEMRDGEYSHKIYLCRYISGEPKLSADAPEAANGPENRFKPYWVPLEKLPELPFIYWQPIQQPLINGLANGFSELVKIVSRQSAR